MGEGSERIAANGCDNKNNGLVSCEADDVTNST
jgi:hypothetical protein